MSDFGNYRSSPPDDAWQAKPYFDLTVPESIVLHVNDKSCLEFWCKKQVRCAVFNVPAESLLIYFMDNSCMQIKFNNQAQFNRLIESSYTVIIGYFTLAVRKDFI